MAPFAQPVGFSLMMAHLLTYVVITPNDNVVIHKNAQPRPLWPAKGNRAAQSEPPPPGRQRRTTTAPRQARHAPRNKRAAHQRHAPQAADPVKHPTQKERYGRNHQDARKAAAALREDRAQPLSASDQRRFSRLHANRPDLVDLPAYRHVAGRHWHRAAPAHHRLVQQALQLHHGRHGHHVRRHHRQELHRLDEPQDAGRQGAKRRLDHDRRAVLDAASGRDPVHRHLGRHRGQRL